MAEHFYKEDQSISIEKLKNNIYKEIEYLHNNSLLSGIKLDEEKHDILYYSLEKRKKAKLFVTLTCPNCGTLVDVLKNCDGKCTYCGIIVEDSYSNRGEE